MKHAARASRYSRKERDLLRLLGTFTAASVYEAMGQTGAMTSDIKPIAPAVKLCGFAYTVQGKPADNLCLHHAILEAEPCEVIVASVLDYAEAGYWGEIMTTAAAARRIRGLVFDGSVRDSREIASSGFPIFCKGKSVKCTQKSFLGRHGVPVVVGGVSVSAGDFILGDDDGVVALPRARIFEIARRVEERIQKEETVKAKLKSGGNTVDLYHLPEFEKEP